MKHTVFFALCLLSLQAGAQTPTISVAPALPLPGSIVRITVMSSPSRDDSIVAVRGTMAGEPLRFLRADSGRFHAIGGVPVEAADSVAALVVIQRSSNGADTVRVAIAIPPTE